MLQESDGMDLFPRTRFLPGMLEIMAPNTGPIVALPSLLRLHPSESPLAELVRELAANEV